MGKKAREYDQGHVTKNQPITVLVFLSENWVITMKNMFKQKNKVSVHEYQVGDCFLGILIQYPYMIKTSTSAG